MGHTYSNLLFHVVFGTKERRPLIHDSFRERLHQYMSGMARNEFRGALAIGGTNNHLHGLIVLPTSISVAEAMRKWKGLSSKWLHETFPSERDFGWQDGYGAFTVSKSNVPEVAAYIERQAEHHKRITFEDEFIALLERHGIEYDPQYVWD
ncbi:MAG TPA: IS200/IS605 family transposase [Phycisphaerae bacterium]|nr:IS200/IS605 family transposase [Phycisphaerae bacterium]